MWIILIVGGKSCPVAPLRSDVAPAGCVCAAHAYLCLDVPPHDPSVDVTSTVAVQQTTFEHVDI